jgi:hypothetical protein
VTCSTAPEVHALGTPTGSVSSGDAQPILLLHPSESLPLVTTQIELCTFTTMLEVALIQLSEEIIAPDCVKESIQERVDKDI